MKNKLILCVAMTMMLFTCHEQFNINKTNIAKNDTNIVHIAKAADINLQNINNISEVNNIETTTQPVTTTTSTTTETTTTTTTSTTTTTEVTTTEVITTEVNIAESSTESIIYNEEQPIQYYEYSWSTDGEYWYFEPSGWILDNETYYTLCNCVANEAGSYWITEYDKALVCEVIYNRLHDWGYSTVHEVVAAPNQFTNSYKYINLTDQYYEFVNDQVISAVAFYCSYPEIFTEGYHSFTGDGYQNKFVQ